MMSPSRDYKLIPQRELVEDCALEHAIDFEKLNECAAKDDGAFGIAMLRGSVQRTADVCSPYPRKKYPKIKLLTDSTGRCYEELHSPTE